MTYLEYFHQEMIRLHDESIDFHDMDPVEDIQIAYEDAYGDNVPAKYRIDGLDKIKQSRIDRENKIRKQNEEMQQDFARQRAKEEADPSRFNVYVGGQAYPAKPDENGTLRFIANPCHQLVTQLSPVFGGYGTKDPNTMAIAFQRGAFSLKDYAEMNIGMGYSVGGFLELSSFGDLEVITGRNPDLDRSGRHFTPEDEVPKVAN